MANMMNTQKSSPDDNSSGFLDAELNALRYDGQMDHPREVAGVLRSMMPSNVRVLDVGCGTGSITRIVNRDKNNQVQVIEPDRARATVARERGLDVYEGFLDDEYLAIHDLYDVVMASDVLEHVPSPADMLSLMIRAAKPGGHILVSVPNIAHWSVRLNLLMGNFDHEPVGIMDATHLRWFTERTIRSLFEQSGLELVELRQTAGTDLPTYYKPPIRFIPRAIKSPAIRAFASMLPRLFGVQHVIKARVTAGG